MSVQVQVLDTDYDNFMIGYECFDNMEFALDNETEPVHIMKVGILTRTPEVDESMLDELVSQVLEMIPEVFEEELVSIKQGEEGECEYENYQE